jgi:hypothetical protein
VAWEGFWCPGIVITVNFKQLQSLSPFLLIGWVLQTLWTQKIMFYFKVFTFPPQFCRPLEPAVWCDNRFVCALGNVKKKVPCTTVFCFMFCWSVHLGIILVNDQLDAQFFLLVCLFQFSTCSEQPRAHHQENQLYQYNVWYMSLCVGDRLVCRSARPGNDYFQSYSVLQC